MEQGCRRELIERFRLGQQTAFAEIIEKYKDQVHSLADRLTGWSGCAEDIVQDVFLAAFANRKKFRADSSIKTWLFTITANKCRSLKYRHRLRKKFLETHKQQCTEESCTEHDGDEHEHVRNAVMKLPDKYRQVVVLKYLNELDNGQIAEILNVSTNAVSTRLSRAIKMLKEYLGETKTEL